MRWLSRQMFDNPRHPLDAVVEAAGTVSSEPEDLIIFNDFYKRVRKFIPRFGGQLRCAHAAGLEPFIAETQREQGHPRVERELADDQAGVVSVHARLRHARQRVLDLGADTDNGAGS